MSSMVKLGLSLTQGTDDTPAVSEFSRVVSATKSLTSLRVEVTQAVITIDLSEFTTIDAIMARNLDPTNDVQLLYSYLGPSYTFDPNDVTFSNVTTPKPYGALAASFAFQDSGFRLGTNVTITGASNASNNATDLPVTGVIDDTEIRFDVALSSFVNETDTNGPTLQLSQFVSAPLGAGAVHVGNNVVPADGLEMLSNAGEPAIDVWVVGT